MVKTYRDHTHLATSLQTLPDSPGVYLYFDSNDVIIYIGKAKNLKKRVMSYFTREKGLGGKVAMLVRKIAKIEHIVVETEGDALLLENNLIKEHQPKYNIQLKDDKTYPWLCLKKEHFPRLFPTRNVVHDGSEYFGPYASVRVMNNLLGLVRQLHPLRTCKLRLTPAAIEAGKFRVCLEYHIKNCKGPCEGFQSEEDYQNSVEEIRMILKGKISQVMRSLREMMSVYAANLEFEKAQRVKDRLLLLEQFRSKSVVVNTGIRDVDVFTYHHEGQMASVNYLKIIEGAIVQSHNVEVKNQLESTPEEVLPFVIHDLRHRFGSEAPEVVVPFKVELPVIQLKITVPSRSDKLKLLELSEQNLKFFVSEQKKKLELLDPERHVQRIMRVMQDDLKLKEPPVHIECFDNSNLQGSHPVAAMVVFRNGRPARSEYRHYNIKTVVGPDDFASMEEIIFRRYSRMLKENQPLPGLIIVDGGKGQLSAAVSSLQKLGLYGKMAIIGIAKRLEEIYFPDDSIPLHIDKRSETLRIIQHARNEAHRFGISHHRKKREKVVKGTELTAISGIGPVLAAKLLSVFRSVKKIKEADMDSLAAVAGKSKALLIRKYFDE